MSNSELITVATEVGPDVWPPNTPVEDVGLTDWQLALYKAASAAVRLAVGDGIYSISITRPDGLGHRYSSIEDCIVPPNSTELSGSDKDASLEGMWQLGRIEGSARTLETLVLGLAPFEQPDRDLINEFLEGSHLTDWEVVYCLASALMAQGTLSALEVWEIASPKLFKERYRTAIHEAGHAVAHYLHGNGPIFVSIVPDVGSDGVCVHCRDLDDPNFELSKHAVEVMAGPMAELGLTEGPPATSMSFGDAKKLEYLLTEHTGSVEERMDVLSATEHATREMLTRYRYVVEELAEYLLNRHFVFGDELKCFLERRIAPVRSN